MCLSKVFLDTKQEENLIAEEVAHIVEKGGAVELSTLFSQKQRMEGYGIGEVNLTENYIILRKHESRAHE